MGLAGLHVLSQQLGEPIHFWGKGGRNHMFASGSSPRPILVASLTRQTHDLGMKANAGLCSHLASMSSSQTV